MAKLFASFWTYLVVFVSLEENGGFDRGVVPGDVRVRIGADAECLGIWSHSIDMSPWVELGTTNRLSVFQGRHGLKLWFSVRVPNGLILKLKVQIESQIVSKFIVSETQRWELGQMRDMGSDRRMTMSWIRFHDDEQDQTPFTAVNPRTSSN
jgi:hypothetical protein